MNRLDCHFRSVALALVGLSGLPRFAAFAQSPQTRAGASTTAEEASLKDFLQNFDTDKGTRYVAAFRDLNGDGQPEAIVYLVSNEWCGSGGCNTLILTQTTSSWRIVTNVTITQLPIRVLTERSNGWLDIGVWVQGGGIQNGYEAKLVFNGKTYPTNPTVSPARRIEGNPVGEVVIGSVKDAVPLYRENRSDSALTPTLSPSFDCVKASSPTEKLICSDPELAAMDRAMARVYQDALRNVSGDQKANLRREQAAWFRQYARACNSLERDGRRKECIIRYLTGRLTELGSKH